MLKEVFGLDRLTFIEQTHLLSMGCKSIGDIARLFEEHNRLRKLGGEPCWDCKSIAKKLGFQVYQKIL